MLAAVLLLAACKEQIDMSARYVFTDRTIADYLSNKFAEPKTDINDPAFDEAEKAVQARIDRLFSIKGKRTVDSLHKKLGNIMWEYVGMARSEEGLKKAIQEIKELKKEFYEDVCVPGEQNQFNQELEKARPRGMTPTICMLPLGSIRVRIRSLNFTRNLLSMSLLKLKPEIIKSNRI